MQKVTAQIPAEEHSPIQHRADFDGRAVEAPGTVSQLSARTDSGPHSHKLAQLASMVDASRRIAMQRKISAGFAADKNPLAQFVRGESRLQALRAPVGVTASNRAVIQEKTDVKEDSEDAIEGKETSSKRIATPTQGEKWFRYKRDSSHVIESFANNIYSGSGSPGSNPVVATVDLANNDKGVAKSAIPELSRARHFALGDAMIGKDKSYRTGTYTWHHKTDPYKMELVDMYTHGGFFHYGGFSQWKEGEDDDDD